MATTDSIIDICSSAFSNVKKTINAIVGRSPKANLAYKLSCNKAGIMDVVALCGDLSDLIARVKSKDFQNRVLRNFVYVGIKWTAQVPTIVSIIVEIVQLLDNVFGLIKVDMLDLCKKVAEFTDLAIAELMKSAKKVSKRISGTMQTEAQGFEDYLDDWTLTGLCAGIATILGGTMVGVGASCFGDGWKVIKRYSDYGRSISNLERGARSAWTIAETIFSSLHKMFQNILGRRSLSEANIHFLKTGIDISNYIDQINGFLDPLMSFEDKKKICTTEYMRMLRNTGNKVEGLLLNDIVKPTAVAKQIILGKIKELRDFMKGNNFRAGDLDRIIPYGVTFVGNPGCGKSLAANLLANKLTEFDVVKGSPYKQGDIYFWMPVKKFMDNYEQQAIVMIDDMACTKDVAGSEAPEHKLLQMFSNGAYYPEMARLEDKGRAFISEVIIASTNTAYPAYESLRDPTALHRRRNLMFEQVCVGEGHLMSNWRFKKMYPVRPKPDHNGLIDHIEYSFEEVVAMVIVGLEEWRDSKSTNVSEVKINPKFMEALRNKEKFSVQESLEERQQRFLQTEAQNVIGLEDDVDDMMIPPALEMEGVHWIEIDLNLDDIQEMIEEDVTPVTAQSEQLRLEREWNRRMEDAGFEDLRVKRIKVEENYQGFLDYWYIDVNDYWHLFEDASEFYEELYTDDEEEAVVNFAVESGEHAMDVCSRTFDFYRLLLAFLGDITRENQEARTILQTDVQMLDEDDYSLDYYHGTQVNFTDSGEKWYKTFDYGFKRLATSIEDTWYHRTSWISDSSWDWLEIVLGILAGTLTIIGAYRIIKRFYAKPEMETEALNYDNRTALKETRIQFPESVQYDVRNNLHQVKVEHEGLKYDQDVNLKKTIVTMPEGCANKNTRDMLQGRLRTNTYWLVIRGNGLVASSNAVMLRGTDLIFPKHDLTLWEGAPASMELEFELIRDTNSMKESIPFGRIKTSSAKDFAFVRMSCGKVHSHKSILEWIAPEDSLARRINGFDCATACIDPDDLRRSISYHYGRADMAKAQINKNGSMLYVVQGYNSTLIGGKGLCGRLLVDTTSGLDKPIVGLHVSGVIGENNSFFYPLSRKDLVDFVTDEPLDTVPQALCFSEIAEKFDQFFEETEDITRITSESRLNCEGYQHCALVSKRLEVKPNYKTTFEPTILHNKVLENLHVPSPLSIYNTNIDPEIRAKGIEPQELAEGKYNKKTNPFSKKHLDFARDGLKTLLMPIVYDNWDVLDLDTALNGDGNHLKPMDMHTSPGTEYQKLSDGHRGKHAFVVRSNIQDSNGMIKPESEQKWIIRDEEHKPTGVGGVTNRGKYLLDDLKRIEQDLKEGREVFSPASSSMKDETLPKAKVWIAKVRLFMTLAMSITILTRRYFGAFLAASVAKCAVIPIAIGVDAYGPQWTEVYRRMNRWGGRCIAADFKSFDSQADGECMLNASEAISDIYDIKKGTPDQVGRRVRFGLVYLFIHTYVVCRNLLYRKKQGMPSGVPVTAPLNSCVNIQYLIMCIKALTDAAGLNYSINELLARIEILVYGDDFVVAIHPDLEGIVTYMTMRDWLAQYQIVITPETKNGDDYEYRSMTDEVTFLKRKWVPEPGDSTKIRAPIEMETIAGIINWQRKNHPRIEMMKSLIEENYLQELFHHGRGIYEKGLQALNDALEQERRRGRLDSQMTQHYANDYAVRHQRWIDQFN